MLKRACYGLPTALAGVRDDISINAYLPVMTQGKPLTAYSSNKFKHSIHDK